MRSIKQIKNLKNKIVLLRGDLDVPVKNGKVIDDFRLKELILSIKYLTQKGAKVIIMGHLGRPEGNILDSYSVFPLIGVLQKLLGLKGIKKLEIKKLGEFKSFRLAKNIYLLENLRFYKGEERNDLNFAKKLATLVDIYPAPFKRNNRKGQCDNSLSINPTSLKRCGVYVNECFATSHRKHASIVGVPKYLPSYAGLNLVKEIKVLTKCFKNPKSPAIAIMGGAKIETKLPLINKFIKKFDYVLIGGRLGLEKESIKSVKSIKSKVYKVSAKGGSSFGGKSCNNEDNIIFPIDYEGVGKFDIGPETINLYSQIISRAKTVVWNGPMGKFEDIKYIKGTKEIANAVIKSRAYSVVGGGDLIAALNRIKLVDDFDFVSTGGGAMLEFLEKGTLPGIEALEKLN